MHCLISLIHTKLYRRGKTYFLQLSLCKKHILREKIQAGLSIKFFLYQTSLHLNLDGHNSKASLTLVNVCIWHKITGKLNYNLPIQINIHQEVIYNSHKEFRERSLNTSIKRLCFVIPVIYA
jgi:hypothetical protein